MNDSTNYLQVGQFTDTQILDNLIKYVNSSIEDKEISVDKIIEEDCQNNIHTGSSEYHELRGEISSLREIDNFLYSAKTKNICLIYQKENS